MLASRDSVERFAEDVGLLWATSSLKSFDHPPDPFEFLRDHVAPSKPCLVRNAVTRDINLDRLVERYSDTNVVVAVTPDGYGDCVRRTANGLMFVEPEERTMELKRLRTLLREQQQCTPDRDDPIENTFSIASSCKDSSPIEGPDDSHAGVFYYSRQNDCLRSELPHLWQKLGLPRSIQWAEEAFATGSPDAVNIWIGNERSVSSMHKDHYENLFFVLSGEKVFTLCPPADSPFLYEHPFPPAIFHQHTSSGIWSVQPKSSHKADVHWIEADVERRDDPDYLRRFPLLRYAHPITVKVQAGECIYIPALWHHRVTQSCETMGINYWYDMKFDSPSWCYFRLCQSLAPTDCDNADEDS